MSKQPFKSPEYQETSFNCPFCNAFAEQTWYDAQSFKWGRYFENVQLTKFCFCSHCQRYSVWQNEEMVYPDASGVDTPNEDLDQDIQNDYSEAASIFMRSARGASALLRLAVQKLCKQLGEEGEDLNTDIGNLVTKKNLSVTIQQSLDALRVIGNESVHPGQIDLRDDPMIAIALFRLLNKIAETLITEPRQIQEIYDKIPESKKEAIDKRDKNVPKT